MLKKPQDRHTLLFIMERIAGMGWLLATDTIEFSKLDSKWPYMRCRVYTEFDSAEFEFLPSEDEACFGTLSPNDLQWTKADIERTHAAVELDSMRCYAALYALERYFMVFEIWPTEFSLRVQWDNHIARYNIMFLPFPVDKLRHMQQIYLLAPNFEVTAMMPLHR